MSKFIVLEGITGSGKSIQIEQLQIIYPDAVFTRTPGGTISGEKMRELLFSEADNLDPITQLYVVHASRWQNIVENIAPALLAGQHVFCDRFQLSTFAYQVYQSGREDVMEHLLETQAQFLNVGINPHYIFLDIEPAETLSRINDRIDNDTFDEKDSDFHQSIYNGYKQGLAELGIDYTVVDARGSVEDVTARVRQAVRDVIEL